MRKGNKRILFTEKADILLLGHVPFKWAVESFITLNKHRFTVKHFNQRYKFWLILPVRARPEFYDDGVQICVKKNITSNIHKNSSHVADTHWSGRDFFYPDASQARRENWTGSALLSSIFTIANTSTANLQLAVRARQCRFVIASTAVVQSRWFPSSTHTPHAVPIAIPGKPANPLVFNINKGMTLWPFDGFPDDPTKKKKRFTFTTDDKFFTSVIQLRTDFSTSGVYTSCFNHNWCKLLRLALKIPVESFG